MTTIKRDEKKVLNERVSYFFLSSKTTTRIKKLINLLQIRETENSIRLLLAVGTVWKKYDVHESLCCEITAQNRFRLQIRGDIISSFCFSNVSTDIGLEGRTTPSN